MTQDDLLDYELELDRLRFENIRSEWLVRRARAALNIPRSYGNPLTRPRQLELDLPWRLA